MEISKEMLLGLLFNSERIGMGSNGIIVKYNKDTLAKIYYKKIFKTFNTRKSHFLDFEIETIKCFDSVDRNDNFKELENMKLQFLMSIGFLKGILTYRGYKIGILMNYYQDYVNLHKIYYNLDSIQKKQVLENIEKKLEFFKNNNLYLQDIKQDNILVRPSDLDVVIIDLDDKYAKYETPENVEKFPCIEKEMYNSHENMIKGLNTKQ